LAGSVTANGLVTSYVRQEIARGDLEINEPPAMANVSAIRDLLLRDSVTWKRDITRQHGGLLPNVAMYLTLSRALIANALGRARQRDAAAWDDLHAAWNLTRSLDEHPSL